MITIKAFWTIDIYTRDSFCFARDLITIMSASSSDNTAELISDASRESVFGECSTDSSSEHRKLLPLDRAKSSVWEYFGFPAENGNFTEKDKKKRTTVYCKLCLKRMNYQGSTTNMMVHLQYDHHTKFLKVRTKGSPAAQARNASQKKQPCITESFELLQPIPQSSKKWKMLTNSVCQYIAKDMMPFSTVNNIGFQKMLNTFEPQYVLPDRKVITHNYMPEMYAQVKTNVTTAMKRGLVYFSLQLMLGHLEQTTVTSHTLYTTLMSFGIFVVMSLTLLKLLSSMWHITFLETSKKA